MKKTIYSLLLLCVATAMSAQTLVKGDMDDDGQVTVADVTSVVNVAVGRTPMTTINVGGTIVDNSSVAGKWYAPDGTHFTLTSGGTTDYPGCATYKYMSVQSRLLFYNASGRIVKALALAEVTNDYLLAIDYVTGALTYYTNQASLVTGLTMSQSTLTMNSGTTQQLTVTATPANALADITWTSSNESVATVDQNGLVTSVAGGSCTITATATDGSLVTATCFLTVIQMVTSITLSETHVLLGLDEFIRLTATVLPANAANKSVVWSSSNSDIAPVRNGRVDAYDYGAVTITCDAADGSGVKATCIVLISDDAHAFVDLGLPSGTLWATMNVGATSPEDYGDYFAWGETTGYNDGKTNFEWSTYQYCNGSDTTMTKYCYDSSYGYNGFTDTLTELLPEDDAATVNWGAGWRMPSYDQQIELRENCAWTWTQLNGVNGYDVVGSNGNSIFLPATGHFTGSWYGATGEQAYYWSRTLSENNPSAARVMYFNDPWVVWYRPGRYEGLSVRAVCAP